jgi:hypothetical protein
MTPQALRQEPDVTPDLGDLIDRFSFRHAAIRTEIWLVTGDLGSDDEPPRQTLVVRTSSPDTHRISVPVLKDDEHALTWIRAAINAAWTHELDEALHVDGERKWDPHPSGGSQTTYWLTRWTP